MNIKLIKNYLFDIFFSILCRRRRFEKKSDTNLKLNKKSQTINFVNSESSRLRRHRWYLSSIFGEERTKQKKIRWKHFTMTKAEKNASESWGNLEPLLQKILLEKLFVFTSRANYLHILAVISIFFRFFPRASLEKGNINVRRLNELTQTKWRIIE